MSRPLIDENGVVHEMTEKQYAEYHLKAQSEIPAPEPDPTAQMQAQIDENTLMIADILGGAV